jgi:hypothetical protein
MADYPFPVELTSSQEVSDDIRVDRSMDGTPRVRTFYARPRQGWMLNHTALDSVELAAFKAFYNDHRAGEAFSIATGCDGEVQYVIVTGPPTYKYLGAGLVAASLPVTDAT